MKVANEADSRYMQELSGHVDIDIWSASSRGNVQVMVSPEEAPSFKSYLDLRRIEYALRHANVQELANASRLVTYEEYRDMDWENYHDLETIYAWMDELQGEQV